MPSVINSDNGVSSGTAGLKTSGASDGITVFQQNGTESARIDASGNVGIGTTVPGSYSKFVVAADGNGQALLATSATGSINQAMYNQGGLVSAQYVYGNSYTGGSILNVGANGTAFVQLANAPLAIGTQGVAQPILFGTNSTERARIDSSGNFLVGATTSPGSPNAQIVAGGTTDPGIQLASTSNGGGLILGAPGGGISLFTYTGAIGSESYSERARITSGGALLVGTTANSSGARCRIDATALSASSPALQIASAFNQAAISFGGGPLIRSDGSYLSIETNATSGDRSIYLTAQTNGVYLSAGATTWTANSDERIKDIIEPITDATDKVMNLRAVIGKYKQDEEGVRRAFLIAQDVQKVLPEAINVREDEIGTLGLQYTDVIPLLVAAVKELKAELDSVKAELAALKA